MNINFLGLLLTSMFTFQGFLPCQPATSTVVNHARAERNHKVEHIYFVNNRLIKRNDTTAITSFQHYAYAYVILDTQKAKELSGITLEKGQQLIYLYTKDYYDLFRVMKENGIQIKSKVKNNKFQVYLNLESKEDGKVVFSKNHTLADGSVSPIDFLDSASLKRGKNKFSWKLDVLDRRESYFLIISSPKSNLNPTLKTMQFIKLK